tara:strand:+ start:391 stop:978 length:588 start_codon:yes stop_codon:yes gene_type:complete
MKKIRKWSNSESRALMRGESMHYYSMGQHYYSKSPWYIWFLGNSTRHTIFHNFLWKYGEGQMVSYTDLTKSEKVGSVRLKIDSIKSTLREGLSLGFIEAYKSKDDRRVTMYTFNSSIIDEVSDYCFMMRRNRMWEAASFVSNSSTDTINNNLAKAGMKAEWIDSLNNFISRFAFTVKRKFGEDRLPNVIPIKSLK